MFGALNRNGLGRGVTEVRILYVADGRSPIARQWMAYFIGRGHQVHLVSTFPCHPLPGLASLHVVPVGLSRFRRSPARKGGLGGAWGLSLRTWLRQWLGPLTLAPAAKALGNLAATLRPDLVHAMRIPFEGMLAARADLAAPRLISVWGNDFTLHARATPLMARETRRALRAAQMLHTDCQRDVRLARQWGYPADRPAFVMPGNGGVDGRIFRAGPFSLQGLSPEERDLLGEIPAQGPAVINPRGLRAYVRNDVFFRAAALACQENQDLTFLCPSMAGDPKVTAMVRGLGIAQRVHLLPPLSRQAMAALFRRAQVMASPSEHDGTPNSMLEAMACGAFPVAGDLESIREWIEDGRNGLLVPPRDPRALAAAMSRALQDQDLRERAAEFNARLIEARADYARCMPQAEAHYEELAG